MESSVTQAHYQWSAEDLSDHFAQVVANAELRTDPSPHLFLSNVFPGEFFDALKANLPANAASYKGWAIGQAAGKTHYQQRKQIYIHNRPMLEKIDFGSDTIKDFWLKLQEWFMSEELQPIMLSRFEDELKERFGGSMLPQDGEVVTNGMINFHEPGYYIGPHPDTKDRIVTAIFYIAEEGAPQELGTHFYRPKDPTYTSAKHGDFDDFELVGTAPYKPNSAVLFLRTPKSYHGVEPISEEQHSQSDRYVLQYMLIHKY